MDKWQAQQHYWSLFGLRAFNEETVPDFVPDANGNSVELVPPYITYQAVNGSLNGKLNASARVWYKGNSWTPIYAKVSEIEKNGDQDIPIDGGVMHVRVPVSNFAQPLGDPNDKELRTVALSVEIEFLSN